MIDKVQLRRYSTKSNYIRDGHTFYGEACMSDMTYGTVDSYKLLFSDHDELRCDRYLEDIINSKHYGQVFPNKDVEGQYETGFELDLDNPRIIIVNAVQAIRQLYEFGFQYLARYFYEHTDITTPELICVMTTFTMDKNNNLSFFKGNTNHTPIYNYHCPYHFVNDLKNTSQMKHYSVGGIVSSNSLYPKNEKGLHMFENPHSFMKGGGSKDMFGKSVGGKTTPKKAQAIVDELRETIKKRKPK